MNEIYLLKARDISDILEGQEERVIDIVSQAYVDYGNQKSSLPHSVFLKFPDNDKDRIIGLPAYLGGETKTAGMKWISSFPGNIKQGIERASALLILNNMKNGHAEAILESSIISAQRTAASAALAAKLTHSNPDEQVIGFIGCGRINREIAGFLKAVYKNVFRFVAYDQEADRAARFLDSIKDKNLEGKVATSVEELLAEAPLVSVATTAGAPYIKDISACSLDSTILNISLRDFTPEAVMECDNVVDDIDHVCRENTSIYLTEKATGNRDFVRCSISEIITQKKLGRAGGKPVMYSPFGLGVLDVALGSYVKQKAVNKNMGIIIEDFLP